MRLDSAVSDFLPSNKYGAVAVPNIELTSSTELKSDFHSMLQHSLNNYDEDEKDRGENNLSFEQLKNELVIHKRNKKEKKMVNINENPVQRAAPFGSIDAVCAIDCTGKASPEEDADYWRMMGILDPSKKRAKTVVELFLPSVHAIRRLVRVRQHLPCFTCISER